MRRFLVSLFALLALASGVSAQDSDGRGVIIEANPYGTNEVYAAYGIPGSCGNVACSRLAELTLPTLFAVDPASGAVIGAAPENTALVTDWSPETGVMRLRRDLAWSDGAPITAYDALYSILDAARYPAQNAVAPLPRQDFLYHLAAGIRLIDDYTLALDLRQPTCSAAAWINLPITRKAYAAALRPLIDAFNAPDAFHSWYEWFDAVNRYWIEHPRPPITSTSLPTSGGAFTLEQIRPGQDARLVSGDLAYAYVDVPYGTNPVEMFLNGATNLLINPPYNRRDDIRAAENIQISELPSAAWDLLIFNTADPTHPRSAFDENGAPLDQGTHPIFGDVRVRRAAQLALDVEQIIEVVFQGNALPLPANLPPTSWAYNADLAPVGFDHLAAERLLDEAGWRDTNGDGLRECYGCLYAGAFQPLAFSILVDDSDGTRDLVAEIITAQLRRVGISANAYRGNPKGQDFDAYLTGFAAHDPLNRDPDQAHLFARAADRVGYAGNVGSYYDPRVDELLEAARTIPTCDLDQRANLYRELQALLQAEQPAAWLYTRADLIAARGIDNFAPYPDNPFWNVTTWVVRR